MFSAGYSCWRINIRCFHLNRKLMWLPLLRFFAKGATNLVATLWQKACVAIPCPTRFKIYILACGKCRNNKIYIWWHSFRENPVTATVNPNPRASWTMEKPMCTCYVVHHLFPQTNCLFECLDRYRGLLLPNIEVQLLLDIGFRWINYKVHDI